jgi:phosphoglycolate phosphatase-like HAD superfamily hydrolase
MQDERPAFVAVDWNGTVVPFFGLPPHAQALDVLARLRAGGTLLFIVSRAPQGVLAADVARVGLEADGVIGCADKAPVLSALRLQHGAGLMIGDTAADQRAASAAGLAFVQARIEGEQPLSGARGFDDWRAAAGLLAGPAPPG